MLQSALGAVAAKVAVETAASPAVAGAAAAGVAVAVEIDDTAVEARDKDFRPAAGGFEWSRSRNRLEPKAGHCCPEPSSSES